MTKKTRGTSPIFLDEKSEENANGIYIRSRRRRIVFGWYGGKFSHLDWLLPLLPECHHYCEPFAGSGAVLLNRGPSPVETYNDIDGEVVNFFRVLRDQHEELIRSIALTPFSREEYYRAIHTTDGVSDVERARCFYIKARQTRTGLAQTATLGRWANCKNTSRAGMSGVVSRWLGGVGALDDIAQRLMRVQIENRPAVDVIRLYDSPKTLFYCDHRICMRHAAMLSLTVLRWMKNSTENLRRSSMGAVAWSLFLAMNIHLWISCSSLENGSRLWDRAKPFIRLKGLARKCFGPIMILKSKWDYLNESRRNFARHL